MRNLQLDSTYRKIILRVLNPTKNIPVPDMYRLRWMGALTGAIFALLGIVLFSGVIYLGFELMYWVKIVRKHDFNAFVKFISKDGIFGIAITFLFFLLLGAFAGNGTVRAVIRKKNAKVFGFVYGYFAIFSGLWLGFNCLVIEAGGWIDFTKAFLGPKLNEYLLATILILGFCLVPAAIFGPLMGFSIEKLSKTPGFGLPKEE